MDNDTALKEVICKSLKSKLGVASIIEFSYDTSKKKDCKIDVFAQIGGDLFLFECKTNSKESKAKKQLCFHKSAFLKLRNYFLHVYSLSYGNIKLFFVSEKNNQITNLETSECTSFNPSFLDDPGDFLLR